MLELPRFRWLSLFAAAIAAAGLPAASDGADELSVTVAGGKTYWGLVDAKTDERQLWLRREEGHAILRRPIAWQRIESAMHAGQSVELSELAKLARRIASERTVVVQPMQVPPLPPPPPPRQPVAALALDAAVANWDGDVEADGLLIELRLLDEQGYETAAAGTLAVELFAPTIRKYHEAPQSRGYRVDSLQRWTMAITPDHFHGGTARVRLPFDAVHPQFDRRVDAQGLVHASLAVPGAGVFEQSLDGVALRSFSPVRDDLLDNTGRWFLPTETTGRGEGAYPLPRW